MLAHKLLIMFNRFDHSVIKIDWWSCPSISKHVLQKEDVKKLDVEWSYHSAKKILLLILPCPFVDGKLNHLFCIIEP